MDYKVLDMEKYYRKDIYRHFTMDCKLHPRSMLVNLLHIQNKLELNFISIFCMS